MEKLAIRNKSRLFMVTAVVIIAIVVFSIIIYTIYETPNDAELNDPRDDIVLDIGTEYPGMIDVTHAVLETNESSLTITIQMKDPIGNLDLGERAQWNVTVILQNATLSDEPKAYEICTELNSTQLSSNAAEIGESTPIACQGEYSGNSLTIHATIDELLDPNQTRASWFILTTFEEYSQNELTIAGSDIAPDEGLQITTLRR